MAVVINTVYGILTLWAVAYVVDYPISCLVHIRKQKLNSSATIVMITDVFGVCASPKSPPHGVQYNTVGRKYAVHFRGVFGTFRAFRLGWVFPVKDCCSRSHKGLVCFTRVRLHNAVHFLLARTRPATSVRAALNIQFQVGPLPPTVSTTTAHPFKRVTTAPLYLVAGQRQVSNLPVVCNP